MCAVGIFLRRELRFNRWDAFHDPYTVASTSAQRLSQEDGMIFVAVMFAAILLLSTAFKLVHLGAATLVRRLHGSWGSQQTNPALAA